MKRIRKIIRNVPAHWVGDGFPVRSLFSYHEGNEFDPFLLLDYAGPHEFAPAEAPRGVGEHPHRGFETVTIVYHGELEHRDSAGNHGSIGPGDVQWMTAASGVVHEEFHSQRFSREGGTLEMVQLWVNLPTQDKLAPPRYQSIAASDIPQAALPDGAGAVRVIAGNFQGVRGPAHTFSPIQLWQMQLTAGKHATIRIAEGDTTLMLVQKGAVVVNDDSPLQAIELAVFEPPGHEIMLSAPNETTALLLSGTPLQEPVVGQGPFVMNTREQIQQAFADYHAGKMGRLSD